MRVIHKMIKRGLSVMLAGMFLLTFSVFGQQSKGVLRGQVKDELGGLVVGASVTAIDSAGVRSDLITDAAGNYVFASLSSGNYSVSATAPGFAVNENKNVEVIAGRGRELNIILTVELGREEVIIDSSTPLSTDPERNASAIVLRGEDLEALPDDPDQLAAVLQAMAGPSAGPNGSQFLVDGFSGGSLPTKKSIREIRLNQNPFSSEYDALGFGRVEIFTKAGTDKFHGQLFFNFSDESLNARNPYAENRAPFQSRLSGGSVSGPFLSKRASYFLDVERRDVVDNAVINATILDEALNITRFGQAVQTPQTRTAITPRIDFQINKKHTLVVRYSFLKLSSENAGVGDFSLLSRAFATSSVQHNLQLTETAVVNSQMVNETRFQFVRSRREREGDNTLPTIQVLDAFTGGGSQVGLAFNNEDRWELQNNSTWALGRHTLRAGVRLRGVRVSDSSPQNFGGTFTFAGGLGPQLDQNNRPVLDPATGLPVNVQLTSIERYRRTLLFQREGFSPEQIRKLGGGASQFSIAAGNPLAQVNQFDMGVFVQNDWRLTPNFTLGLGLRFETQSNVKRDLNFAPRVSFAWSPWARDGRPAKTVFRGGLGFFYERFGENLTLQSVRFNGLNQQLAVVSDPAILDQFPNIPVTGSLANSRQVIRRVAEDLREPYLIQSGLSVEQQLPYKTTLAISYVNTRGLHMLRSRNINAPLPGTFVPGVSASGVRPLGNVGSIFQYESSGTFKQQQLVFNLVNRYSKNFTLFASYILNKAESDTDGSESFPSNSYDVSQDYGRAFLDSRHRFIGGASIIAPWGIRLSPLVIASSGRPFNITTGRDTNGDTLFTERPALATDLSQPDVVVTPLGAFDLNPKPGQAVIPRNFGNGPVFFIALLRIGKSFEFVDVPGAAAAKSVAPASGGAARPAAAVATEKRFRLTLSLQVVNLFNHTNSGTVIGNLSSPFFGQSNATSRGSFSDGSAAGSFNSRRIEAQIRLNF